MVFVQKDVLCNMQDNVGIPPSWMLLDSQSAVDVFCNLKIQSNIREAKRHLVLFCNAGTKLVTKRDNLKVYGTIWYYPAGIANILSLNNLQKNCRVTFDSKLEDSFAVHKGNGYQHVFKPSKKWLYYSGGNKECQDHSGHYSRYSIKINTMLDSTLVLKKVIFYK